MIENIGTTSHVSHQFLFSSIRKLSEEKSQPKSPKNQWEELWESPMAPSSSGMFPRGILVVPVATPVQVILKFTFPKVFSDFFSLPGTAGSTRPPFQAHSREFSQELLRKTNPEKTKTKKKREKMKSRKKTTKVSQCGEGSSCRSRARHSQDLGAFQSPARAGHWWALVALVGTGPSVAVLPAAPSRPSIAPAPGSGRE